ncbi:AraC family transcriptional regulator [Mucilaginibacter jinjuensis]|uniref:AraC family transcriptional regulator n=1 Tax=Mucilaginibacter jinjuensis TaxID=1176721 RepID=A0ABY7TGP2_9SPHI|nr:AraC family transcriptional regulator [Mucilaginibacter jinjuensis]WCT14332.1 AraC family transcriptional regulator [Mucilaginibacter jinjuensis]
MEHQKTFRIKNLPEAYFTGEHKQMLLENERLKGISVIRTDDHFRSCKNAVEPHVLENYLVCLIRKGAGIYNFGAEVFQLKENTLCLIPPLTLTSWHSQTAYQEGFCCTFSEDFFTTGQENKSWLSQTGLAGNLIISLTAEQMAYFSGLMEEMFAEMQTPSGVDVELMRVQLHLLVRKAAALYPDTSKHILPKSRAAVVLASDFVKHCRGDFEQLLNGEIQRLPSLNTYAERLNVTPNHLNDMVKLIMGKSVGQFLHQELAGHATNLLQQTQWRVGEIADRLGFNDLSYFTRFYKKQLQTTPSKVRGQNP